MEIIPSFRIFQLLYLIWQGWTIFLWNKVCSYYEYCYIPLLKTIYIFFFNTYYGALHILARLNLFFVCYFYIFNEWDENDLLFPLLGKHINWLCKNNSTITVHTCRSTRQIEDSATNTSYSTNCVMVIASVKPIEEIIYFRLWADWILIYEFVFCWYFCLTENRIKQSSDDWK